MRGFRRQDGSSLLGVLIALVVIAFGGIAISGLLGNLTAGSGASKARNEALVLAREKTEDFRNFIEKAKFESDLAASVTGCLFVADPSNPIDGVNAQFRREWCICNVTKDGENPSLDCPDDSSDETLANMRKVIMRVSYVDPKDPLEADGTTEKRQNVLLNSFIAYANPGRSGTLATGGTGETGRAAPSTDRSAIEGPEPDTTTPGGGTLDEEGDPDNPDDDVYTRVNTNGNVVVYQGLVASGNVPDPQIKLTIFGGVLLKFSGALHYSNGISDPENNLYSRATSPSFSTWFPAVGCTPLDSGFSCGRYVTYASGDCAACYDKSGTDPATGVCVDESSTHVCPEVNWDDPDDPNIPIVNRIIDLDLKGGWYGKTGIFFLGKGHDPLSCLINEDDGERTPARLYVSHKEAPSTIAGFEYEGINTPYSEHDFQHVKVKNDCSDEPPEFVSASIVRCIDAGSPNTVRPLDSPHYESCTW